MKNQNGFTLVEILGVITILSVLALIAIPTIDNIVTKNRQKLYDSQIRTIEDGLKTWANANAVFLPEDGEDALLLSLGILKKAGFVTEDIKNPNTDLCFSNNMMVSISAVKEGYAYYVDEESGLDGTEEDCSAPTATDFIYLKGSSTINLPLAGTYEEPGFFAFDQNGIVSTSSITTVIKDKNGNIVSSIDTSLSTTAPYQITYTYGTAAVTRVVNIIIGDPVGTIYAFYYTGTVQTINLDQGSYKLEVWGAKGGGTSGGQGGYSVGTIVLSTSTDLYLLVGEAGSYTRLYNPFNGGGRVSCDWPTVAQGTQFTSGGGSTDIRINTNSKYARIIVAGGGGGSYSSSFGTAGGGIASPNYVIGTTYTNGGTQIAGGTTNSGAATNGSFGSGGSGCCVGGGGGWYGGAGSGGCGNAGAGGSGWIYNASTFSTWQIGNATDASNWLLNSSYYLGSAQTLAGNSSIPTHDGTSTMTGNTGNGYAKITKIG